MPVGTRHAELGPVAYAPTVLTKSIAVKKCANAKVRELSTAPQNPEIMGLSRYD